MTAGSLRRGGRGRYRYCSPPAVTAIPLASVGLYAVHVQDPAGATTRVYYCEPATGHCSCGAGASPCPHLAAACALPVRAARTQPLMEEAA